MEKIIYEFKPFALFLGGIYALDKINGYKPIVIFSALLLMAVAGMITLMRMQRRGQKQNSKRR